MHRYAVILVNLGTPATPTAAGVKTFLAQFLSDRRVVDLPRLLWLPLLHTVILPLRSGRVAKAYQQIWQPQGSPLMVSAKAQQQALQRYSDEHQLGAYVELAMTYGEPSLTQALERIGERGFENVLVLPLYPQYSVSTTAAVYDAMAEACRQRINVPQLRWVRDYCDYPAYLDALAQSIESHWQQHGRAQKLLFSFHGIPQRYADNGDPYPQCCEKTVAGVVSRLGLTDDDYLLCYQSRFGKEPWLQPYTDETTAQLARSGVRSLDVICPAFSADCLETLEEIAVENKENFLHAGGESYRYISALNAKPLHIEMMAQLINENCQGW